MKTPTIIVISTLLSTTAANANFVTFEGMANPSIDLFGDHRVMCGSLLHSSVDGFYFSSETDANAFAYYGISQAERDDPAHGGFANGVNGNYAIFSNNVEYSYTYDIARLGGGMWKFNTAAFTCMNGTTSLTLTGYELDAVVFSIQLEINDYEQTLVVPSLVNSPITSLQIDGEDAGFIMDNMSYSLVPAPNALALIGLAGFISRNRRR